MLNTRQLYDPQSHTYTYLLWDEASREAALIDPVREQIERDVKLIDELGVKLKYTLETHVHADHVTSSGPLRDRLGSRSVLHENGGAKCADILVRDGDFLPLGNEKISVLYTPGHTDADVTYAIDGALFTGDSLLIRGCGRTDFQAGDAGKLYDSITGKLFVLPDGTQVYPGHDYNGHLVSTIGEEKIHNPRLGQGNTREEFIEIMDGLKLDPPKHIREALPGNLACGNVVRAVND